MPNDIRKEYNGRKLAKHCVKQGAILKRIKGDHAVYEYNHQTQVIPLRPLGHGLQCKIVKWMIAVGLAVTIWIIVF